QPDPDDDAGDDDDGGRLDDLALTRPLDLLELGDRLADEVPAALGDRPDDRLRRCVGSCRALPVYRPGALVRTGLAARVRTPLLATFGSVFACGHLPGFPVERVSAAPAAVLLELDPVGRVPLRLVGLVVAPLALGARERDSY